MSDVVQYNDIFNEFVGYITSVAFRERLPWGKTATSIVDTLSQYPEGITQTVILSELHASLKHARHERVSIESILIDGCIKASDSILDVKVVAVQRFESSRAGGVEDGSILLQVTDFDSHTKCDSGNPLCNM